MPNRLYYIRRDTLKKTILDLYQETGIPVYHFSDIERGKVLPAASEMDTLAQIYGITAQEVFEITSPNESDVLHGPILMTNEQVEKLAGGRPLEQASDEEVKDYLKSFTETSPHLSQPDEDLEDDDMTCPNCGAVEHMGPCL